MVRTALRELAKDSHFTPVVVNLFLNFFTGCADCSRLISGMAGIMSLMDYLNWVMTF
jgi:hypothetical protein